MDIPKYVFKNFQTKEIASQVNIKITFKSKWNKLKCIYSDDKKMNR